METKVMTREIFTSDKVSKEDTLSTSASAETSRQSAANQGRLDKFCSPQGHGFAAEDANTLYDRMRGRDAHVVGDDNAKNGADRLVDGTLIQTKYCRSAADSVAAAFENGQYRYVTAEGAVMDLEVPADQYEQAVELMRDRITKGEVAGVSDPARAEEIVRKGHFTYAQAKNIAKFGTFESLTFDAVQGAVTCSAACGITAALTFVQSMWSGCDPGAALENAARSGLQVGGVAFVASVVGSQLMRTGMRGMLTRLTDGVMNLIGPKASAVILGLLKPGSTLAGAAAMKCMSKLLRGGLVTGTLTTAFLAVPDIANVCRGRISGKQLFRKLAETVGGITGGAGGYMVGGFLMQLIPGAGTVLGFIVTGAAAVAGSAGGEAAAKGIVNLFTEDDAVEMTRVIEDVFNRQVSEYMLTEEETDIVLDDLAAEISGETLLEMYASSDREQFAAGIGERVITRLISNRCGYFAIRPSNADWLQALNAVMAGDASTWNPQAAGQPDAVGAGRALLGRELPPRAANKGMYAAKQMNMRLAQSEYRLVQMAQEEHQNVHEMRQITLKREKTVKEINELMGGLFDER